MNRLQELVLDILKDIGEENGWPCPNTVYDSCQGFGGCENALERSEDCVQCWQKYIEQELRYMKEPPEDEEEEELGDS